MTKPEMYTDLCNLGGNSEGGNVENVHGSNIQHHTFLCIQGAHAMIV
jgi:hypothetical protein